jgi:hypothetical protein
MARFMFNDPFKHAYPESGVFDRSKPADGLNGSQIWMSGSIGKIEQGSIALAAG